MKGRKQSPRRHRPAAAGPEAPAADLPPPAARGTAGGVQPAAVSGLADWRLQAAALLIASGVFGFGFNAANPLGIRFTPTPEVTPPPAVPSAAAARPTNNATTSATPGSGPATTTKQAGPVRSGTGTNAAVAAGNPSPVDWPEVKLRLAAGEIVLLDARARPYYESGHIPGAQLLSIFGATAAFEAFRARVPTNTPLVVYCGSSSCPLSHEMAERLVREFGYAHVQYMTSGFLEWQRDEGPPQPPDIASMNPWPIAWAEIQPAVAAQQAVLVDVRPADDFDRGHLPGAVSLPETVGPDGLAAFMVRFPKERRIILYGEAAGVRGPFLLGSRLMREHGYPQVKFLTEGYREWSRGAASSPR